MKQPRASDPEISVCVGCYNQRDYVARCLDSILIQDIDATFEILVGDDASTDGSAELIEQYARKDGRILPICRPQNLGFHGNYRDLFGRARGTYVALCDGDDYWVDPTKLAKQLAVVRADSNAVLSVTAGVRVDRSGGRELGTMKIGGPSRKLTLGEAILEIGGAVPTASMMMSREALLKLPEETYEQPVLDYSLQLLVGAQGSIWYDASVTCAYRVGSSGSWSEALALSPEKYVKHHEALRTYEEFLRRHLEPQWQSHLQRAFEPLTLGFYMSSRVAPSDKRRNISKDIPRLSGHGRLIATLLSRAPLLVRVGAFARRRIWSPIKRALP